MEGINLAAYFEVDACPHAGGGGALQRFWIDDDGDDGIVYVSGKEGGEDMGAITGSASSRVVGAFGEDDRFSIRRRGDSDGFIN